MFMSKSSKGFICIASGAALLGLNACAPALLAGGAGAVGVATVQEGGLKRAANDLKIQAQINELWFQNDVNLFSRLDLTVNNGRVLLTGVVDNPEARVEAVRLAWQPKGVEQVINEIRVAKSEGITGFAKDAWISSRLRAAITVDSNVQSVNYTIDAVQGTIYLMGAAQSRRELDRVMEIARTIPGVDQVVSYVKILEKTNPVQNAPMPADAAARNNMISPQAGAPEPTTRGPIQLVPVEAESSF